MNTNRIYKIYLLIILSGLFGSCMQRHDSSSYPLGIEIRSLAEDIESQSYRDIIKTMTKEDLDEEWKRVATPDNYQVFLENHGGLKKVLADKKLKGPYEERKNIANKFIALINDAYSSKKKKPPFNQEKIEKLLTADLMRSYTARSFENITIDSVISSPGAENQWPCFRGPFGQGIAIAKEFPLKWSKTQNILWEAPLTGRGNSSPVIWDNRVFITSASIDGKIRELICFNRLNGELLWKKTTPAPEKIEKINPKNSYATSTPVTDGKIVIAFFGNCGFFCYNMDGELLWKRIVGEFTTVHGPGTNPILYKDKVILVQDQGNNKSVFIALNKFTGEIIWSHDRGKITGWASPVIVHLKGHDELIYNGSFSVKGYNPDTGEQLWTSDGPTKEAVPMIVTGSGLIFSASGRNGTILAIRPGGNGDITDTHLVWLIKTGGPHVPSPVYHEDRLYIINDTGFLTCLNAGTGQKVWSRRLKGKFTASPVIAADKLILTNEEGLTTILNTGDNFKVLYENDLAEETLASPAVLEGCIFIRTALHLYCIGKK
jgi:outer membrane protein assembly factor BamB